MFALVTLSAWCAEWSWVTTVAGGPALLEPPRGQQRTHWNVATAAGPGQQPFLGSIIARLLHSTKTPVFKKPDVGTGEALIRAGEQKPSHFPDSLW